MGTQDLMGKRWMTEAEGFLPRWHDVINLGSYAHLLAQTVSEYIFSHSLIH